MKDAFKILGATPSNTREEINELFEDKQLVCDDEKELSSAYSELTTPKKRVKHEVLYFSDGVFKAFDSIFDNPNVDRTKVAVENCCDAVISVGKWLDGDIKLIYDKINTSRELGGFPCISSDFTVLSVISDIKFECVNEVGAFLDASKDKSIILFYNTLVKRDNFQCFFVDELLARYEIRISGIIQEKEDVCSNAYSTIEKTAKAFFINQGNLKTINAQVAAFRTALSEWDYLVQPLQVNAQRHGANHDRSKQYVHDIRNKVIDLSNESQEVLIAYIDRNTPISSYASKKPISETLHNYIFFCDIIISLIKILQGSFAEIETTDEQLKKDVVDISDLKNTLYTLVQKVDPYGYYKNSATIQQQTAPNSINTSDTRSAGSFRTIEWMKKNNYKLGFGIAAFICLILLIVGFSIGNNAMGVAFIVIGLSCCAFIALEKKTRDNSTIKKFIVGLTVVVLLCSVIPVAISGNNSNSGSNYSSNSSSSSGDYIITLNKQGGSGGTGTVYLDYNSSMPSATAPTKSGYTFGGYYTSTGGGGTQYYSSSMSSVKKWNQKSGDTLYAYWISNDTSITLFPSNFENYFNATTSASWSGTSFKVTYSVSPKSSVYASKSSSSSSITVRLKVSLSSSTYGSAFKTDYIDLTLYKSFGYKKSGTESIYLSTSYTNVYWSVDVYSCNGKIGQ